MKHIFRQGKIRILNAAVGLGDAGKAAEGQHDIAPDPVGLRQPGNAAGNFKKRAGKSQKSRKILKQNRRNQIQQIAKDHIASQYGDSVQTGKDRCVQHGKGTEGGAFIGRLHRRLDSFDIPKQGIAQGKAIEKRNAIHPEDYERRFLYRKQPAHIAREIDGADVIAKGEQKRGLPSGKLLFFIALGAHSRPHGKSAQKADEDAVNAGIRQPEQRAQNGRKQSRKTIGKTGINQKSGKDHEGQQRRNHL